MRPVEEEDGEVEDKHLLQAAWTPAPPASKEPSVHLYNYVRRGEFSEIVNCSSNGLGLEASQPEINLQVLVWEIFNSFLVYCRGRETIVERLWKNWMNESLIQLGEGLLEWDPRCKGYGAKRIEVRKELYVE